MNTKEIIIDAGGKTLGRIASAAAKALMGKTSASYTPHIPDTASVRITNASKMHVTDKKMRTKVYNQYSGYPGGLRNETLSSLTRRKGNGAALKIAIERMLPGNTMRVSRMKRLTITD
jgi:large subunit ribosomal protein L13